ncbi:MAG: TetR/AcrR family transcriptional regulator [Sphingomonadales bacterium]|nr:TetR/AcrR family transcriptional regulator [Sphingomonadales bacterium]
MTRSSEITAEILAAATAMFTSAGYEATSIDAIARRAGIPKTTLYKRYPDKQALLRAVIQEQIRVWSQASARPDVEIGLDLRSQLAHLLAGIFVWVNKPEVRAVNRLFAHLSDLPSGEFPGEEFSGYQLMRRQLADAIETYGPAEGIHAQASHTVARALMDFAAGVAYRLARQPVTPEQAEQEARYIVELAIAGERAW